MLRFEYILKRLSFGSKECTKELKLESPNLRLFLSLRNHLIKMIKIVYITLVVVSNMVDQGRIILQNFGLWNLSIGTVQKRVLIQFNIIETHIYKTVTRLCHKKILAKLNHRFAYLCLDNVNMYYISMQNLMRFKSYEHFH